MDVTIRCQLSLSKKLRAIIQEGETRIALISPSITDGRGEARLVISSDKNLQSVSKLIGKETSIMLVPIGMDDITVNDSTVSTLFAPDLPQETNVGQLSRAIPRTPLEKVAAWTEPENETLRNSIKTDAEIKAEVPEEFQEVNTPEFKNYIETLEALDQALIAAQGKISDINPDNYQDPRQRAEAMELKEKLEAIDEDAFIVNDKCANLSINDLGINLVLNSPYNLANISARRLAGSKELRSMFKANLVKFIKPEEIALYMKAAENAIQKPTLDIYSSPEEAEDNMSRNGMNVEKMELSVSDLSRPTESESLLTNLTASPMARTADGITKTIHGNTSPRPQRNVSEESQANAKGVPTIRRTGLSY